MFNYCYDLSNYMNYIRNVYKCYVMLRNDEKQLYGYVISSKIRIKILEVLFKNSTLRQSEIAKAIKQKQQNIYKSIDSLTRKGLIECLNPEKKAWKSYMITELGKSILQFGRTLKENAIKRNNPIL